MPAFNFKYRFAKKVESGEKRHTIRARRKNPPRLGQAFHAFEGMRTMKCRRLLRSTITLVEPIRIAQDGCVYVAGRRLTVDEAHALARADGFTSANELYEFFKETHDLPFDGDLIHWVFPPYDIHGSDK
jgi:hypothetical protein